MQDCQNKLKDIGNQKDNTTKILHNSIMQALDRVKDEKKVCITCRAKDKDIVESLLPQIKQEFIEKMCNGEQREFDIVVGPMKQQKRTKELDTEVDKEGWLHDSGCGGVIICAHGDEIKVNNTLEKRLDTCFSDMIPLFRDILFAQDKKPQN